MTIEEHLLITLAEEAAELQKVIAKALRFGLDDKWRDWEYDDSPRNLIVKEFNDLYAVAEMLSQTETLPWPLLSADRIEAKKMKVRKFFNYSREQGRLSQ